MIWQLDLMILTLVVICAVAAINLKDLLGASVVFGIYSFLMCLLWAEMGAVDVAFTEAIRRPRPAPTSPRSTSNTPSSRPMSPIS
jgi:energy-converting hydrogenase B subunit D